MKAPIVNGLIIAAGFSERMSAFKPLMKFKDELFINRITSRLLCFCNRIVIVTGHQGMDVAEAVKQEYPDYVERDEISIIYNPDYEKGMFTSLQTGIAETGKCDWVLYHFVDQPFFETIFYSSFISEINDNYDWLQPEFNGKEGHPILFNRKVMSLISKSPPNLSLREIKYNQAVNKAVWKCNYRETLIDFDTKENIQNYLRNQQN